MAPARLYKSSFIGARPHSLIYVLSTAAFMLQQQSLVVTTETACMACKA